MNIPKLKKIESVKKYHKNIELKDEYSWVDQPNILEVLKDPNKLNPETKKYIDHNNNITKKYFADVKDLQKRLFSEIKGKIKLDDTSLKFKDKRYFYWVKTEKNGNYGKKVRQIIDGSKPEEIFWDGDLEKKKCNSEYFNTGSVSVSHSDELLAYSLDTKGSEYFTIHIRNLETHKELKDRIYNTSGSITWSLDSKSFFYSKLDNFHRPRKIFKHVIGSSSDKDKLIYEEKDETFTCGISLSADEKYFVISTSDHITVEEYYFPSNQEKIIPKLFKKRKKDVRYSIDSWKGFFYIHTNENARDNKIQRCKIDDINNLEDFIPATKGTIVGGLEFLDNYILRSEKTDAKFKIYARNLQTNVEEEIKVSQEAIGIPGLSLLQKDTNTTKIRIGWESMKTPGRIYEYDIKKPSDKKLVKETEIPSGHDPDQYIVERINAKSPHDGRMIPISLVRKKDSKLDGKSKVIMYAYGAYKTSIDPGFSPSRFCLIDRGFTYAIAHIRGGGDLGDHWHTEAKLKNKKNTFLDYITCAKHLIKEKYTYEGGICFYGGSAGGLTGGAVANMEPKLFFSMLLLVPFVDPLTTMLNKKLPLTPGEWILWGNPIKDEESFKTIRDYSPYENLKETEYPNMLITSSLFDSRVLFSEPVKYFARLKSLNKDNNVQLLKCRTEPSSHGGPSGRDNAINELAEEFSFILKTSKITK